MDVHNRESGRDALQELVESFDRNRAHYQSPSYNESETRLNFIDPFWRALGWPVGAQKNLPPNRVDVRVEIKRRTGRPDYQFQPDALTKFFCEAKRPADDLTIQPKSIFQAKSYAWSFAARDRTAPFAVLTDFARFRFFKADEKPLIDRPEVGLVSSFDLTFDHYVDVFDRLWETFSRDAVASGSLDAFLDLDTRNRRTLDREFLKDLLKWRRDLAQGFWATNEGLEVHELDEAVQRVLDRIVFIRMMEDKGVEPAPLLHGVAEADGAYKEFVEVSRRLDQSYNGLLFKTHFSEALALDEEPLKRILSDLDPENSPYKFDAISVELLGRIYESFLGHCIQIDKKGRCEVAPRRERLKAGGIYYTPQVVVDYMVEQTIGASLKDLRPGDVSKIRILDPACGSGSFLIGAYDSLLRYHEWWYQENRSAIEKKGSRIASYRKDFIPLPNGTVELSLSKRAQILTDCIFGVDIDPTAVEIATLSLYLKMLEGAADPAKQLVLIARSAILPDLSSNLKCGNSLIEPESIDAQQLELLDASENRRLNAFSWNQEFKQVLRGGGFDAVIGNPPYIKEYVNRQIFLDVRRTPLRRYCTGKMDIWYVFACLSIDLLRPGGRHSFISQNNWVNSHSATTLRAKMRTDSRFLDLFDFHNQMMFEDASIQTMIYVVKKERVDAPYAVRYRRLEKSGLPLTDVARALYGNAPKLVSEVNARIDPSDGDAPIALVGAGDRATLDAIEAGGGFKLQKNELGQGIIGGPDDAFLFDPHTSFTNDEKLFVHEHYTSAQRFSPAPASSLIAYLTRANFSKLDAIRFPNFEARLRQFKKQLQGRRETKSGQIKYFQLHWPRDERLFAAGPKIACPTRVREPSFFFTTDEYYASRAVNMLVTDRIDLRLLCGILNSSTVYFWLLKCGKRLGSLLQIDTNVLLSVPIPCPKTTKPERRDLHNVIIDCVEGETDLRRTLQSAKTDLDKARIRRSIERVAHSLDEAVFALYGLSASDRVTIEKGIQGA